jgi:hypothetical protein
MDELPGTPNATVGMRAPPWNCWRRPGQTPAHPPAETLPLSALRAHAACPYSSHCATAPSPGMMR